ncbi:unnamed protein product [Ectocarpus sp. 12 AP-2014]
MPNMNTAPRQAGPVPSRSERVHLRPKVQSLRRNLTPKCSASGPRGLENLLSCFTVRYPGQG